VQVVANREGKRLCYVTASNRVEGREVETGSFNDNFVEVKSGLTEGEMVMLSPPRWTASESAEEHPETEPEPPQQQPTTAVSVDDSLQ
jgi:hypothetical protein